MSDYYFINNQKLTHCTSNYGSHPIMDHYSDYYGTDFVVHGIAVLGHDIIEHINGQKYIGGVADEIMAIAANATMNYQNTVEYLPIELAYQVTMFLSYDNYWGKLPTAIEKMLFKPIPNGKYKKLFNEHFTELVTIDHINSKLEEEYQCSPISTEQYNYIQKLLYWGMVKTLHKYSLSRPTCAPIKDAWDYLISPYRRNLPCEYLKFSVTNTTLSFYTKEFPNASWNLEDEVCYHAD